MSNLEHLRKQAKLYLRWHRNGYFPVAARIRSTLPRFAVFTDREILASTFKLNDAQELIARKSGFESWAALVKGLQPMSASPTQTTQTSTIVDAEPQILVTNLSASCSFYRDKLGFQIVFSYGDPAFYAQISRDGARVNLRQVQNSVFNEQMRATEPDVLSATLTLDDAKPIYLELQAAGVPFHQNLRSEPWGARTFIIRDPDGNLILFAGQAA